jgi:hypothetical protein
MFCQLQNIRIPMAATSVGAFLTAACISAAVAEDFKVHNTTDITINVRAYDDHRKSLTTDPKKIGPKATESIPVSKLADVKQVSVFPFGGEKPCSGYPQSVSDPKKTYEAKCDSPQAASAGDNKSSGGKSWTVNMVNPDKGASYTVDVQDNKTCTSKTFDVSKGGNKAFPIANGTTHIYWFALRITVPGADVSRASDDKLWCGESDIARDGATVTLYLDPQAPKCTAKDKCKKQ